MILNSRRISRDVWIGLFFLFLLTGLTVVSVRQETQQVQDTIPYFANSYGASGTRALYLWLEAQGFQLEELVIERFTISAETDLILMLEPSVNVSNGEWQQLDTWVEGGGILVIVGEGFAVRQVLQHYDIGLATVNDPLSNFEQVAPLFPPNDPLLTATINTYLESERDDWVVHITADDKPILASFVMGRGRVFVSSTAYQFSNIGLQEAGNPAFVSYIVQTADGRTIWFDDWHHGLRSSSAYANGPGIWLRETAVGQSFLFIALLIFVWLVLKGRGFGRPVPLPENINRRTPLEYITAIANLNRRANNRSAVMKDTYHRLKRHLGTRYRLSSALPDEDFLKQLYVYRPDLATDELRHLLTRLQQNPTNEAQLVQTVAEAYEWMDK